ncbi:MAG: hypothetical protein ACI8W8_000680 [Rhodothermales bacterium]|jgi:hypothetical protein
MMNSQQRPHKCFLAGIMTLALLCAMRADVSQAQAADDSAELPVFIVAGQSNAFRLGSIVAPEVQDDKALWYYPNPSCIDASKLDATLKRLDLGAAFRGSGFGIAAELTKQYPDGFGVIRYAVCGSNLRKQWTPGKPDGYYNTYFLPFVQQGLVAMAAGERKPRICGMFWHQGESDSHSEKDAAGWQAHMNTLVSNFHEVYGEVPVVMGEIRAFEKKPATAQLNKGVHAVAEAHAMAVAIKLGDVTWQTPTNVHFSKEGARVAGVRMVQAVQQLAEKAQK